MIKLRVYVGCALTHAGKLYKRRIAMFIKELKDVPWIEVLEFVDSLDGVKDETKEPLHIYTKDIHGCVGTAHAMIGEITLPSTGLGWELATAAEKHAVRVLMCARRGKKVSFIPRGAELHGNNDHVSFHWYHKSILELVPHFLKELKEEYDQLNGK